MLRSACKRRTPTQSRIIRIGAVLLLYAVQQRPIREAISYYKGRTEALTVSGLRYRRPLDKSNISRVSPLSPYFLPTPLNGLGEANPRINNCFALSGQTSPDLEPLVIGSYRYIDNSFNNLLIRYPQLGYSCIKIAQNPCRCRYAKYQNF